MGEPPILYVNGVLTPCLAVEMHIKGSVESHLPHTNLARPARVKPVSAKGEFIVRQKIDGKIVVSVGENSKVCLTSDGRLEYHVTQLTPKN